MIDQFSHQIASLDALVRSNEFHTARGLDAYIELFETQDEYDLVKAIVNLGNRARLLDAGCGDMLAIRRLHERGFLGQAVGTCVTPTEQTIRNFASLPSSRYSLIADTKLEELSDTQLGKFNIIVDVQGAFTYSSEPHLVLNKMFEISEKGCLIYINYHKTPLDEFTEVKNSKGKMLEFFSWLKMQQGAPKVVYHNADVVILKVWNNSYRINNLQRTELIVGIPPIRRYEEIV